MEGTSPPRVLRDAQTGKSMPRWDVRTLINSLRRGSPMSIIATGIDLAKNVFAVHGVNLGGTVLLRQPKVGRAKLLPLIAGLPPTVIGMEASSGAHYWARQFQAHGHMVRLMAPKLVTPYRMTGKRGKNDAADAAAICEAMQRPNMRFVPIKTEDQQARLMVHRARQGFVTELGSSALHQCRVGRS